eukprot:Skav221715  [mRNA]  locus=scaffold542:149303:151733:- [translate_table: standard]
MDGGCGSRPATPIWHLQHQPPLSRLVLHGRRLIVRSEPSVPISPGRLMSPGCSHKVTGGHRSLLFLGFNC